MMAAGGGKRKADDAQDDVGKRQKKDRNAPRTCVHEVAVPDGFVEETVSGMGSIREPVYTGEAAKKYPFTLDPFQRISVACLERQDSVLVSAHTSAGKTAIAEYAIAMAFRDKQKVIYTSPLKALSNQKYRELSQEFVDVGLMTGDVTISPNASCIVMTTEILRAMLYRGSELLREVAWVVFDEIHYMRDRERGVVWEESIILLPPAIKMVFLSATMSNALEFAQWICHLHKQPCHVVYTDFRPTPLQHYAYALGGSGMFLIVDDKGQFKEDNFSKLQAEGAPAKSTRGGGKWAKGKTGGGGGGGGSGGSDIYKVIKVIMDRKMQPVIVFSFSRRECEQYALSISKLDFNDEDEKQNVQVIYENALQALSEEDRSLPAIGELLPLLKRGIAFHHSGLLPILKEVIEILFQEGYVKALFATETFAMGLNMPAKTVVFTALRKWDGDAHRWMSSGEYIQMSGRAGRRGKDDRGICIIMIDEQMEMKTCKEMILGKPAPLISTFRLSYYSLLNLMSRTDGQIDMEFLIRNSFHQFQHEKAAPEVGRKIAQLEQEAASLDGAGEAVAEYHDLRLKLAGLEKQLMTEVLRPDRVLIFLQPGRLVKVRDGANEWGWGVVLNVVKKPGSGGAPSATVAAPRASWYLVDTLLYCSTLNDAHNNKPRPCAPGDKGEMQVIPVQMTLICAICSVRVAVPADLRPADARMSVFMAVQDLEKRFPDGLPRLDPIEDMGIDDPELIQVVKRIKEEEEKLIAHPLFKSEKEPSSYAAFQKKAELLTQAQRLKAKMRESQLHKFREELRNRTRVLKRLGHINDDSVVQLKGRAACLIDTADELLVAELILEGLFNDLDHHQIVALSSCFLPIEKSTVQVELKNELAFPYRRLQETARMIAEVERECKLEVDVEKVVEGYRPTLMNVFYHWCKGSSFAEICGMTDVFEGSIIRVARRLDEFLNQMRATCHAVGNSELEKKLEAGSEGIRRGIMFANSLYL